MIRSATVTWDSHNRRGERGVIAVVKFGNGDRFTAPHAIRIAEAMGCHLPLGRAVALPLGRHGERMTKTQDRVIANEWRIEA